jgi:putative SOS response-associated peptidase YedK
MVFMCGRFTLTAPAEVLKDLFPLFDMPDLQPRYNIAPTQPVVAVRHLPQAARPEFVRLRWGLVPHWADDLKIGYRLINARADSAAVKPAFRSAVRQRRCLILADGFYEWQKLPDGKQPYRIRLKDGKPFAFAGLWDRWHKEAEPVESCTILTTDANDLMRPLHDRMPVILDRTAFERWLDPTLQDPAEVQALLRPFPSEVLQAYPVSTHVNNAKNEDPACIAPLAG